MRRLSFALLVFALSLSGCDQTTNYRLVSEKYNFSVEFPATPTEQTKLNDEGLPKSHWEVNREKLVMKDFFSAEATSYKELLNPNDELTPNEALLAINGIKMLDHRRFKIRAKETGREIDAMQTTTKEDSTGVTLSSIYVVDGHTMISVTARTNEIPRQSGALLRVVHHSQMNWISTRTIC